MRRDVDTEAFTELYLHGFRAKVWTLRSELSGTPCVDKHVMYQHCLAFKFMQLYMYVITKLAL